MLVKPQIQYGCPGIRDEAILSSVNAELFYIYVIKSGI